MLDLFAAQVASVPAATAIVLEGQQLTYAQLNARANRLAHHLIALGVRPETLVGVCIERSVEMVVAVLGILKAGGGHLPLDPGLPPARRDELIADAGLAYVVTGDAEPVGAIRHAVSERAAATAPATDPAVALAPANLAYACYTS